MTRVRSTTTRARLGREFAREYLHAVMQLSIVFPQSVNPRSRTQLDPEPVPPPVTTEVSRELPPTAMRQPESEDKWPVRTLSPEEEPLSQSDQGGAPVPSVAEGILVETRTSDWLIDFSTELHQNPPTFQLNRVPSSQRFVLIRSSHHLRHGLANLPLCSVPPPLRLQRAPPSLLTHLGHVEGWWR
ncbi:MHC class II regulatory factor RFX1-like [Megalobrama amblycephala]|uniref:MHC class II regulatory factor RFX1-like n=1 Tax=Megalobrama amblycephala TaxID=75352 RepID=UPI0020140520|nr:MHC class II regulatory factor RFX1-like [Megalobrama amblycephala]